MRVSIRIVWVTIGIVIGVFGFIGLVRAQTRPPASSPHRLIVVPVTSTDDRMKRVVFIKDSQSGACWLAQLQNDGSDLVLRSVAPSPTAACQ